jgi:pSer/pThr/pTyr-binding forkhead associated (FHA) protein
VADTVECAQCGHVVDANLTNCPYCHHPLGTHGGAAPTPDPPAARPAAPPRPEPEPPRRPTTEAAPQIPPPRSRNRATVEVAGGCVLRVDASGEPVRINAGEPVVLGRESPNDLIGEALNVYDEVSREHAVIVVSGGKVEVSDRNSTNGTRVGQVDLADGGSLVADLPVTLRLGGVCDVRLDLPG